MRNLKIGIIAFSLLLAPIALAAEKDLSAYKFGFKYLTANPDSKTEMSKCFALGAADHKVITACKADTPNKACPKCEVDKTIRRCKYDEKFSINIFPSKEDCIRSLHDSTEGDDT